MTNGFIQVRINGETKAVEPSLTLSRLLQSLQVDPKSIVVERNREIVSRDRLEETPLQSGDEIEIVHFVGGGKSSPKNSGPKNLVIVESPTKAKTLLRFLGPNYQIEASM